MVVVFLAEGFEEIEALATVDILRRCGIEVETVSITDERTVTGAHKIPVLADKNMNDMVANGLEAVILPGGLPGSDYLQESGFVNDTLHSCFSRGALVAAICAAPKVLGAAGLLNGKRATCYPGFEGELKGATHTTNRVEIDGNVITSRGAGTAHDFAFAIATYLGKEKETKKIREAMLYDI
ncbi:MAG: DJ-1/PfpI family protein [Clostridia bacterium]|nr:DJ-1/PfpI family protein [Clostridia bacterium]